MSWKSSPHLTMAFLILIVVGTATYALLNPAGGKCPSKLSNKEIIATEIPGFKIPVLMYFIDAQCHGDCRGGFGDGGYIFELPGNVTVPPLKNVEMLYVLSVNKESILISWEGSEKRLTPGDEFTITYDGEKISEKMPNAKCDYISMKLQITYVGLVKRLFIGNVLHLEVSDSIPLLGIKIRIYYGGCGGIFYMDFPLIYEYNDSMLSVNGWMQERFLYPPPHFSMLVEEGDIYKPVSGVYKTGNLKLKLSQGQLKVYRNGKLVGTLQPGEQRNVCGRCIQFEEVNKITLKNMKIRFWHWIYVVRIS